MAFQENVVITVDARQANSNLTTLEQRLTAVEQASRGVDASLNSLQRGLRQGFSVQQIGRLSSSISEISSSSSRAREAIGRIGGAQSNRQVERLATQFKNLNTAISTVRTSANAASTALERLARTDVSRSLTAAQNASTSLRDTLASLSGEARNVTGSFRNIGGGPTASQFQRLERRVRALREQLSATQQSAGSAAQGVSNLGSSSTQTSSSLRRTRSVIQNVAFQLQDVSVQAQAGTSALIILGQQGPQLLGAFGAFGAVAGVFVAVGAAVASALIPSLGDATEATEALGDSLDRAEELFETSSSNATSLAGQLRTVAEVSRDAAISRLTAEILSLEGQLESAANSVTDLVTVLTPDQLEPIRVALSELADSGQTLSESIETGNASESVQLLSGTVQGLSEQFGVTTSAALRFVSAAAEADLTPTTDSVSNLGIELQSLATSSRNADDVSQSTTSSIAEQAVQVLNSAGLMASLRDEIDDLGLSLGNLSSIYDDSSSDISLANADLRDQVSLQELVTNAGEGAARQRSVNNALLEAGATVAQIVNGELSIELQRTRDLAIRLFELEEAEDAAADAKRDAATASRRAARERQREEDATERLNARAREAVESIQAESAATQESARALAVYRESKSAIAAVERSSLPDRERLIETIREEAEAIVEANQDRRDQAAIERQLATARRREAREQERAAQRLERAYQRQFDTINEGLADALLGYRSLRDVATSVAQDIARAFVQNQITGPLLQGLGLRGRTAPAGAPGSFSLTDIISTGSSLFNNAGSATASLFGSFARSSVGQFIGLSTPGASSLGISIADAVATGVPANATLTGFGSAVSTGLNYSPYGIIGNVLGSALGVQGSGNAILDTAFSTAGSIGGGYLGSQLGFAAGGPIGAALGAIAGTALAGLFGGEPSDMTQATVLRGTELDTSFGLTDDRFSQENRDAANAVAASALALRQFLTSSTGAAAANERNLAFTVGSRDGLFLQESGIAGTGPRQRFETLGDLAQAGQESIARQFGLDVGFFQGLQQEGEQFGDTVIRVEESFRIVTDLTDELGLSFDAVGQSGREFALQLTEAFGGIENVNTAFGAYYQNFFSEEERRERVLSNAEERLNEFNTSIGRSGEAAIDTREEFRAYIESLDLTTEAGADAAAEALGLQGVLITVADAATEASTSVDGAAASLINLDDAFATFNDNFLTDAERINSAATIASTQLAQVNAQFGLTGDAAIDTREEFRDYILSLDQTTEAGREAARFAFQFQDAILAVAAASDLATQTEADRTAALQSAFSSFGQSFLTEEQRITRAADAAAPRVAELNSLLGLTGDAAIDTSAEFRDYILSLDQGTEAGREAARTALAYQDAFVALSASEQLQTNLLNEERQRRIDLLNEEVSALSQTQSRLEGFIDSLMETSRSLTLDDQLSSLSPENRLALLRSEFTSIGSRAQLGNEDALARLPQISREFLEASRDFFGTSQEYISDFNNVQNVLNNAQGTAERQVDLTQRRIDNLESQIAGMTGQPAPSASTQLASTSPVVNTLQQSTPTSAVSSNISSSGGNVEPLSRAVQTSGQQESASILESTQSIAFSSQAAAEIAQGGFEAINAQLVTLNRRIANIEENQRSASLNNRAAS